MGLFSKPGPEKLSAISNQQIWPLGNLGLNRKFLWFPKTGYGLNQDHVLCREISVESEGTQELQTFFGDLFAALAKRPAAKMEEWPNEAHFNEAHEFLPQDATTELGRQGENQKLLKLFGFIDSDSEGQAIYFSKVSKAEDGPSVKSLVKVVELSILENENAWFIINQVMPKSSTYKLCLFMTLQFQDGATEPSHLYLHLPRNYQEIRSYLDKVGL